MNRQKELQTRIDDLQGALGAIGRVLRDEATPVKRRIDMALGILFQYEAPKAETPKADAPPKELENV